MDDADRADEVNEEMLRRKIQYLSHQRPMVMATGICLNCEATLPDGQRWCDKSCADDWEKRRRK